MWKLHESWRCCQGLECATRLLRVVAIASFYTPPATHTAAELTKTTFTSPGHLRKATSDVVNTLTQLFCGISEIYTITLGRRHNKRGSEGYRKLKCKWGGDGHTIVEWERCCKECGCVDVAEEVGNASMLWNELRKVLYGVSLAYELPATPKTAELPTYLHCECLRKCDPCFCSKWNIG